jgi:hypothetical protein
MFEFKEFGKIPRLFREVVVTEKIDGTNACIIVSDDGTEIAAQSRNRLITPEADNYGFARWVQEHKDELLRLGPGHHYGEWWGKGINRGYGLEEKRFSLFNVNRWAAERPACCHAVPILNRGIGIDDGAQLSLDMLRENGSFAAPGFMKPEGVVVFHTALNGYFKATLEGDAGHKNGK